MSAMDKVWKKLMEAIAIAIKKPDIPPIISGARGLIENLSALEAQICAKAELNHKLPPIESLANIIYKYGDRDIYKDVYQFIKA